MEEKTDPKNDPTVPVVCDFLEDILTKLRNDKLSPDEYRQVGEFYMSYRCQTEVQNNIEHNIGDEISDQEMMKFLFLGWFVYRVLLLGDTESESDYIKVDRDDLEKDVVESVD